jgi:xylulokinase
VSLLGIDVGTTGCKAVAFGVDGVYHGQAYREYPTLRQQPGYAELDTVAVWEGIQSAIREVAILTADDPITALSVSSMGEAVVPVSHEREILGNSILCSDVRGGAYVDELREDMGQEEFYRINPNLLGTQYSLPKLLWLRENDPELFERADLFLLWGDFVNFMLGAEPVAANSLANRTLLFDLKANDWSDELLNWSAISRYTLGDVVPGGTVVGKISPAMAESLGLPPGVKLVSGGHDQCCNALGAGCVEAERAVCGIGTFECITPVFAEVEDPLRLMALGLNIEHHVLPDLFVSFLYNQSGSLVRWFRDTFAANEKDGAGDIYDRLTAEMPTDPTSLFVLPYFDVTGPPEFVGNASGVIAGLKTHTTRGDILKAIMESTTFYFAENIQSLEATGIDLSEFVATGGGAQSDAWLQIKADIFGTPFIRPAITECSALGAAMLAGIATGIFGSAREAAGVYVREEKRFTPNAERHAAYRERLAKYCSLLPMMKDFLRET